MKYHEMLQKRETIARQMRELNDTVKTEKRSFDETENKRWGDMLTEHDDLAAKIEREEQLRSIDEKFANERQEEQRNDGGNTTEQRQAEAFTTFLRQGFSELTPEQKAEICALGTGSGATGGFTVPTTFVNKVVESMKAFGGIANACQVINTANGAEMQWAVSDGRTEMGEMLAENTETGKQDPTFSQATLGAKKGSSKIILVSNEMLQDSGIDIDAFIARRIGQRLGRLEASQIVQGTGAGNNVNGLIKQVQLSHQAAAAAAVAYEDLIELKHAVDPAYRMGEGCRFAFNDATLKGMKLMKDGQGRPLWLPSIAGVAPATIDGDQYVIDQALDGAETGKTSVLYGDFMNVILRRVTYQQLRRLTERYAEFDQMGFIGFHRFDVLLEDLAAVAKLTHA